MSPKYTKSQLLIQLALDRASNAEAVSKLMLELDEAHRERDTTAAENDLLRALLSALHAACTAGTPDDSLLSHVAAALRSDAAREGE